MPPTMWKTRPRPAKQRHYSGWRFCSLSPIWIPKPSKSLYPICPICTIVLVFLHEFCMEGLRAK